MVSIIFSVVGGLLGLLVGKLSKSPEIILIGVPIGAFIGYKFAYPFWRVTKALFSRFLKIAPSLFKQVK
jgi:type III secretory pathway component EscT